MNIRPFKPADLDQVLQLFYDTVHTINAADYTKEQLDAWAPLQADKERWLDRLTSHYTLVVETEDGIIGFGDLDGCTLDHLYVHKDHQRKGVAALILKTIEDVAKSNGCIEIFTESSITARPFFEAHGYKVIAIVEKKHRGAIFTQHIMRKDLQ